MITLLTVTLFPNIFRQDKLIFFINIDKFIANGQFDRPDLIPMPIFSVLKKKSPIEKIEGMSHFIKWFYGLCVQSFGCCIKIHGTTICAQKMCRASYNGKRRLALMRKTIFEKRLDRLYREKWKTGINPQEVLIPNIFKERQNVNNGFINRNRIEITLNKLNASLLALR